jgi:hypothetical protein
MRDPGAHKRFHSNSRNLIAFYPDGQAIADFVDRASPAGPPEAEAPAVSGSLSSAAAADCVKSLRPASTTDTGTKRSIFLIDVASKDRSCFHRASTARPTWKQLHDTLDKTVVPTMS